MIVPAVSSRRLIGRDAELQSLHDARRSLSRGRGGVVLIGGEAGMGKTRLLSEFTAALGGGRSPYFAQGECLQDAPRPFGPFRALLLALLDAVPTSLDAATPLVRRALGALVPDVLEARGMTVEEPPSFDKAELFFGVLRFIEGIAAKRAVVLAIEDLHWSDPGSLDLLVHLATRIAGSRVLIIATYRDDESDPAPSLMLTLGRLEREQAVGRIALEPLEERQSRALIEDALGADYALDPNEVRAVIARAEGNPFFTEELLKKALERPQRDGGVALPVSIRAMILERVMRLGPEDRDVLDHASVLGAEFDAGTLGLVMGKEERELLAALRRLRDQNLIVESNGRNKRFRFRHALTRQTVYDELLSIDTQRLHEHIVHSLSVVAEDTAHLDELAYHAFKAGLRQPTLRYSELAGDAALGMRASAQAAAYYERAIEVAGDDETRIRLLGKAGEAYLQSSAPASAAAACMAQQKLLVSKGRYDDAAPAVARAAGEFVNDVQIEKAFSVIDAFLNEHEGRLSQDSQDRLRSTSARIATASDRFERARSELAKVPSPDRLLPFTHQVYWYAHLYLAEDDLDESAWKRAVAALREGNAHTYPLMRSQMLHSIANTALTFAELGEAERSIEEAIAIDKEWGLSRALAYANGVKAAILSVQGRLSEASTCINAALGEPDMLVIRIELAACAAPAAIAAGDDELAQRCLESGVLKRVRQAGQNAEAFLMQGMEAARLFALGRDDDALPLMNEALDGESHQFAVVYLWPLAARHADDERLSRIATLCAAKARRPDDRVAQACGALLGAELARRSGDENSQALATVAAERYHALGWPLHEAQALELAGRKGEALALYRASGSVVAMRRLEMHGAAPLGKNVASARLSPREREVAALVAEGHTNRAIAETLCVGEKTIEKYVSGIYAKLKFSTRAQLAAHVARMTSTG